MTEIYADGKPRDCRACYYYEKKSGCTLKRCYYLIDDRRKRANVTIALTANAGRASVGVRRRFSAPLGGVPNDA